MERRQIVLETTGAIGDAIIASAVMAELYSKGYEAAVITSGFTKPLLDSPDVVKYDKPKDGEILDIPEGSIVVPLDHAYLEHLVNMFPLPEEFSGEKGRMGHLCEWMAYDIFKTTEGVVHIMPSQDDIKLRLAAEEITAAYEEKESIQGQYNKKPLTHLVLETSSVNKNLPKETINWLVDNMSKDTTFCIAEPINSLTDEQKAEYKGKGVQILDIKGLRDAAARLHVADAIVATDTGFMHGSAATRQGTRPDLTMDILKYLPTNAQLIGALGSSHPEAVGGYEGMQYAVTESPCRFCGTAAYKLIDLIQERTGVPYVDLGDGSGCTYPEYAGKKVPPPCMQAVRPHDIREGIMYALENGKKSP